MRKVFICISLIFLVFLGSFVAASSKENKGTSKSLFRIQVNGKDGYMDRSGKIVIKPQFDEIGEFSEGLAAAAIGNKYGYINKTGKFVIKPQFSSPSGFSGGIAQVMIEDELGNYKWGYIDKTGRFIWSPTR